MGLFSRYEQPGKGVPKNPEDKLPFYRFFELYFMHFTKLIMLNFMYIICFLPFCLVIPMQMLIDENSNFYTAAFYVIIILCGIVIGPATCGMAKLTRNMSQERPVFLLHDFVKAFKDNFKQGAVMGVIDMLFVSAVSVAFPLYYSFASASSVFYIPFGICLICSVLFLMMHFYIYLLMISTTLGLWKILKNSFLLTAIDVKSSILNLVVTAIIVMIFMIFFPFSAVLIIILPSFMAFMYAFNCYPVIREYVIQPWYDERGEQNPEDENFSDEQVFIDAPELETEKKSEEKKPLFGKKEKGSDRPASSKRRKTIR